MNPPLVLMGIFPQDIWEVADEHRKPSQQILQEIRWDTKRVGLMSFKVFRNVFVPMYFFKIQWK